MGPEKFAAAAVGQCAGRGSVAEIAAAAAADCGMGELKPAHVSQIAEAIERFASTLASSQPLADEIAVRIRPLREAWEARGPGLLAGIARGAGAAFLPTSATILPVYPAAGGGGDVFPERSAVTIEAVLANPHPQLPEIVRLGWLLARLGVGEDEPASENAWSLALVPLALAAAEHVELARCDAATIALALQAWRLADAGRAPHLATTLLDWWTAFREQTPPLADGVAALARRLAGTP